MKKYLLSAVALMTLAMPVFANQQCACNKECKELCAKGQHEKCTCECGCKDGKGCTHQQCSKEK